MRSSSSSGREWVDSAVRAGRLAEPAGMETDAAHDRANRLPTQTRPRCVRAQEHFGTSGLGRACRRYATTDSPTTSSSPSAATSQERKSKRSRRRITDTLSPAGPVAVGARTSTARQEQLNRNHQHPDRRACYRAVHHPGIHPLQLSTRAMSVEESSVGGQQAGGPLRPICWA